jgi:uncharacterized cupin superfamily protein
MVGQARLMETEAGVVPEGDGWFVVNAHDARWYENEAFGQYCRFEGEPRFPELGINVSVLHPGQPSCMYHREDTQEDFLILGGECLLLIEGEERPLKAWDFVHCPPWTDHVFVGGDAGPCFILSVGARPDDEVVYPVAEVARKHGAGVLEETSSAEEAYAPFPRSVERRYQEGDLPNW